jgi:hypothetical protein
LSVKTIFYGSSYAIMGKFRQLFPGCKLLDLIVVAICSCMRYLARLYCIVN